MGTKRKRPQNDDSNEFQRITKLKYWEFNNEIEASVFKTAFSKDELLTYLNLHLRFLNAKKEEYTNIEQKFKKQDGYKEWRQDNLDKLKKFANGASYKTNEMIKEILADESENEEISTA